MLCVSQRTLALTTYFGYIVVDVGFIAGFVTEEPEGIIAVIDDIMFREIENGIVYTIIKNT